MKCITAIELHNFLAFYGTDNKISLPNGENLLMYGENGSGKSSLFRALEVFFEAKNQTDFDKNYRNIWVDQADSDTSIKIDFVDIKVSPLPQTVELPVKVKHSWIEESRLASGFLTYRDILKTHFLEAHKANLFDLVVNEILRGFKNPMTGKILSQEWADFEKKFDDFLLEDWGSPLSTRPDEFGVEKKVMDIISDLIADFGEILSAFEDSLELTLEDLNPKINTFLESFEHNIHVKLVVGNHLDRFGNPQKGTMLSHHNSDDDIVLLKKLRDRAVDPDVQIGVKTLLKKLTLKKPLLVAEVTYFEQVIPEYQSFLNEARLSALSICIFLAALSLKPDPPDGCKVLFLDDVLIGLDSGNRLPLLRILETHFKDFQIMISTYDRHWFETSKRFTSSSIVKWKHAELFAKEETNAARRFIRPVLHDSESNMARALYYFKNSYRPDYPAAINYLRKTLEELIQENLPPKELKEQTGERKGNSRLLRPLLAKTKGFFKRIHQPTTTVDHVREKLRTLLNPLSHFETDTSIYRNEVQEIFLLVDQLENQFRNIKPSLKEILPQDSWIQIQFIISETEIGYFRLKNKEILYSLNSVLSNCSFWTVVTHIVENGNMGQKHTLKKEVVESYTGLKDAYDKIFNFCQSSKYPNLTTHPDYLDTIFIEENGKKIPIKSRI